MMHRLLWALVAIPGVAGAQSRAESDYLRARSEAVSAFTAQRDVERQKPRVADLERRFRAIVGPVTIRGFRGAGRFNAGYVCVDAVCSSIDGLLFGESMNGVRVTTPAVLSAWLADAPGAPQTVDSALRSLRFLASALGDDMAIVRYADLPIPDAARRGVVSAMLMLRAQDDHRDPPDRLLVTVARRNRIYIVQVPPIVPIDTLPACVAPLDSALAAATASGREPEQYDRAWNAYRACYHANLTAIPGFDRIIRQVTTLVDALPPNAAANYGLSDLEALQGKWTVSDARARMLNEPAMIIDGMVDVGTIEFAGSRVTMRQLGNADFESYTFTLDTLASPRRIRLADSTVAGLKRWTGLYQVRGDTLRLSLPIEHYSDRPVPPASFNGTNTAAYTFRRPD